jgi:DNA-binding transcriptional LysR family regulator
MVRMIHDWFAADGITVQPVMEMNADETTKMLVAAGFGASIRPSSSEHAPGPDGYDIRPLKPPLMWKLATITRRDKPADRALTIMREALMTLGGKKPPARKSKQKVKRA